MENRVELDEVIERMQEVKNNLTQVSPLKSELINHIKNDLTEITNSLISCIGLLGSTISGELPLIDERLESYRIDVSTMERLVKVTIARWERLADYPWNRMIKYPDVDLSTTYNLIQTCMNHLSHLDHQFKTLIGTDSSNRVFELLSSISTKINAKYGKKNRQLDF